MSQVVFIDPVDHISGKISKKYKTIFNYRSASGRKYTQVRGKRTTPVSIEEKDARFRFKSIAQAVNTRLHNMNQQAADQAAFAAQTRYKTLRQYVWAQETVAYDESNS
jgi:hypothetical protein